MVMETEVSEKALEAEKENMVALAKETSREQNEYCLEALYYTSFRDHMMGQPKNGNRD